MVYLLNRTIRSNRKDIKTAYEAWTRRKPDLRHVKIFVSVAYKHVLKQSSKKLKDKFKMILLGYQGESSNYIFYDPISKCIQSVSRDVLFDESLSGES